ncbi:MAG: hypothetical protein NC390_02140 [Fusobacterium sp.]|nr:hypothetical protein [Fusobacterium sp.]
MTRDFNNVIEVIDDLKASSLVNVQILKKSLQEIDAKLEEISDADELILVRNSVVDFKESLDNKFFNVVELIKELKKEASGDELAEKNAQVIQEKFQQIAGMFNTAVANLIARVDDVENKFSQMSDSNFRAAHEELTNILDGLKIFQQESVFFAKAAQEDNSQKVAVLAENLKLINENVVSQTNFYKELLEGKYNSVKELLVSNQEELKEDNSFLKSALQTQFRAIEEANTEYTNDLETIKASIAEALNKADKIPAVTSNVLQKNFDAITISASDTLLEIKKLQDAAGLINQSVNTVIGYTEQNQNSDIIAAMQELNISKNIADLFERVDVFNNNFNIKTEFLEEQILQLKSIFADVAIDIQNKEAELLQKESERLQQYFNKISVVAEAVVNLEERLKLSGLEYKEQISNLGQDLNELITGYNNVYSETSTAAREELGKSFGELKELLQENSLNYSDKLVIMQQQFTQSFRELYEIVNVNNQRLIEAGIQTTEISEASLKLMESLNAKLDVIAGTDYTINFEELSIQNEETQELVKILQTKIDKILMIDFDAFPQAQKVVNSQFLEYLQKLSEKTSQLTETTENIRDTEILEVNEKIVALINELDAKIDVLASIDYEDNFDELLDKSLETQDLVKENKKAIDETTQQVVANRRFIAENQQLLLENKKLATDNGDMLLQNNLAVSENKELLLGNRKLLVDNSDMLMNSNLAAKENKELLLENKQLLDKTNDLLLTNSLAASEQKDLIVETQEIIDENSEMLSGNRDLLKELHAKLDVFVATSDNAALEDELEEIKELILEQQEILSQEDNSENERISANIDKLLERIDGISKTIDEHDENSAKIKEDLVHTVVSVFSNSNFVEETEEIKDFVEEKTGELSKQLITVQSQIQTIKQNEIADYSYTLADVESDIAKLRVVLNDISSSTSSSEINQISRNIHNLTSSIDSISKNLTPAEIYQLKNNILKLNDDILSISSRTNKLLLNSDEAQKTISEGLLAFSHMAFNLEERISELSNKEFNAELAEKLERMTAMLDASAEMDKTFHQVMMYLGEWVDAASDTFESINDKANEINEVSEALSELRKAVPEKFALIDLLEERFEEQQSRMDRLEAKIDELIEQNALNSNISVVQKVDKMERMLAVMSNSIEKLTSYVD